MSTSRRRIVASGALATIAAAVAIPQTAQAETAVSPKPLPTGISDGFTETVLTAEAAQVLTGENLTFTPTAPATAVDGQIGPSVHLPLALGATTPDVLTGYVVYDGGFVIEGADVHLELYGFTSDLVTGMVTALASVDGTARDRVPVFTYEATEAKIDVTLEKLTLTDMKLHLTEELAALFEEVFGQALFTKDQEIAVLSASADFTPAAPLPGVRPPQTN
jgi:hypothetical protein